MSPELEQALGEAVDRLADATATQQALAAERDRLIVRAFDEGAPLREIARVANLTHPRVLTIVRRAQKG